ncbi:MAG: SAM-dependent chlorinase/fluorinase [Nitrospiraceae bacterium]|nr:SAM-dependent chlorinase/fluorinase [Nitrospiraceae bacterium]
MPGSPVISLTTDFGSEDPFAGVMKGVILTINPVVRIVDITHGIHPHDIKEAAYTVGMNYRYFPLNTIHIVVVDPGVGSGRRPLIVSADHHFFIGPDNGVFSYLYQMHRESAHVTHITAAHYFLSAESATFQGRDVFAPVAAWFSRGVEISKFGDPVDDYVTIPLSVPVLSSGGVLTGEVVHIDRFGNAITNITPKELGQLRCSDTGGKEGLRVRVKGSTVAMKEFYEQGGDGGLHALMNSSGCLELFVFQGNASGTFHIATGDQVEVVAG